MKTRIVLWSSVLLLCMLSFLLPKEEKIDKVTRIYHKNEEAFLLAAETGDFSSLSDIRGVKEVSVWEDHVDIWCGGAGLGSSTHYYGIFYSAEDDLCAIGFAGPRDELIPIDDGYRYQQKDGDNRYYVKPLGSHYFYYEAHF